MDAQQKQQIADRLLKSNNILVTVSTNPSVDQLAACIGLTLALNKMGKHAAAVFSGQVPNTLEFLQPEKTIEKTTDSLRDFIISLDKSKADKLRYKVEDTVVKIFITPYKTSISDKDLEFSQGDFNVDIVIALGVRSQADIDQAITAHGRILHDAVLSTINVKPGGQLGTVNWLNPSASSLSEMVVELLKTMNQKVLDGQMATSFLTGIVAETQRFSNAKTQPQTMTISAELMAAGANQQLVATKLEPPKPKVQEPPKPKPPAPAPAPVAAPIAETPKTIGPLAQATGKQPAAKSDDGAIEIDHIDLNAKPAANTSIDSLDTKTANEDLTPQIDIDHEGTLRRLEEMQAAAAKESANPNLIEDSKGRKILQPLDPTPPPMTGALTPAAPVAADGISLPQPNYEDIDRPSGAPPLPAADSFGSQPYNPAMPTSNPATPTDQPAPSFAPSSGAGPMLPTDLGASGMPPMASTVPSLSDDNTPEPDTHVATARGMVDQAIGSQAGPLPPITALNALPVNLDLRGQPQPTPPANSIPPPPGPPPMLPPPQG